jgi:hypothetical protein
MADRCPARPATARRLVLPLALLAASCIPTAATAQQVAVVPVGAMTTPGDKGAQIYCFMRDNGNNHQVSWDAAYEVIKRQGNGLFRTSPQHAAVMITESVVQSPASFPNCGMYLGDLYRKDEAPAPSQSGGGAITRSERYGY